MATSTSAGVHAISDGYVRDYAAADPVTATLAGVPGHDHELPDLSPDGFAARGELARAALRRVQEATPADESERIAAAVFTERVGLAVEIHEAGLDRSALNVIESPVQDLRIVFDLMPTDTEQDWATIATRLAAVPQALAGLQESYRSSAAAGTTAALRQVQRVAEQCDTWSGSFFGSLVDGADGVPETLRAELRTGAVAASTAYGELGRFLREELASSAPVRDAVGAERYALWSRYFLGATVDLAEAYDWGWQEFARLEAEMREVAGRIAPGGTMAEAAAALDVDPRYKVCGQDGFLQWMQQLSDRALDELGGSQFDIPDRLRRLECRIAPPGGGVGAYYTGPDDEFTRPGRMWWSVPADREEFATWREVTTVYHEGVPGHHLQVATAVHVADRLNSFQRLMCFISGHGEGWALYAERLMRELGYLDDDGNLLGMLDAQLFRAARVVVDIGMHLELPIPAGTGFHEGERWTPELGLEFMLTRTISDPAHVRDEIDRYLGWPGQAPSYKLGERRWLDAREDARRRHGADFDLAVFHRSALELGPMGLDTLSGCLAEL